MAKDEEMYGLICKERFDKLEGLQVETLKILRGRNSDPGLVDEVRELKRSYKRIWAGSVFVVGAITIQVIRYAIHWISGAK